jgi:hypothetical protein
MFRPGMSALALVVACGGNGRVSPSATLPVTAPSSVTEPSTAPAPPVVNTDAAPGPPIPRFAALDADLDREYPLSAIIRREGPLYLSYDGAGLFGGDRENARAPVRVVEAAVGRNLRRPRLLCEQLFHRVAVYMDASDLATVAQTGAVLRPDAGAQGPSDVQAPGVYFAPGAELEPATAAGPAASDGATTPVHYEGLFLHADGFVATDHVDVVFSPPSRIPANPPDGELIRNVAMSLQPDGPAFAHITKDARDVDILLVRRLGNPIRGFVLVQYDEDDAFAIGWVPTKAVRAYHAGAPVRGGLMGQEAGGVLGGVENPVKLARGTLLFDPVGQQIVGVVETEEIATCDRACASSEPIVSLPACLGTVEVRAGSTP